MWFGKGTGYNVNKNELQNIDVKTHSPECNMR